MIPSEYTAQRARALDRMNLPDIEAPLNIKVLWLDIMHAVDKEARSYSGTHNHSFYELHFVLAGRAVYECEQDTVTLRDGQALLLTPHTPHRFVRADADLFKVTLAFAPEKVGTASLSLDRCGYRTFAVTDDIVRTVDRVLRQAAEGDIFTPTLISNHILEMLYATFRALALPLPNHYESEHDTRYLVAKAYIDRHKQHLITCEDVAKECCLSAKQLSRIFRANTDMSLFEYIISARIKYAEKLLHSRRSIKEIGYMLGFENESSFIAFFKRHRGVPPGIYRRENVRKTTENVHQDD